LEAAKKKKNTVQLTGIQEAADQTTDCAYFRLRECGSFGDFTFKSGMFATDFITRYRKFKGIWKFVGHQLVALSVILS